MFVRGMLCTRRSLRGLIAGAALLAPLAGCDGFEKPETIIPVDPPKEFILPAKAVNSDCTFTFDPARFGGCFTAQCGYAEEFIAPAGKRITVSVTGPVAASRPTILVVDQQLNIVAAPSAATSQRAAVTFDSPGLQQLIVAFNECGPAQSGAYQLEITAQ